MEIYGEGRYVFIRKLIEDDYPLYREINYSHFAYKDL